VVIFFDISKDILRHFSPYQYISRHSCVICTTMIENKDCGTEKSANVTDVPAGWVLFYFLRLYWLIQLRIFLIPPRWGLLGTSRVQFSDIGRSSVGPRPLSQGIIWVPWLVFRCKSYKPGCWAKTEQLSCRIGPRVLCLRRCTVCHIKSWSKFKLLDFHQLLENLLEGQKKVPRVKKKSVL
jgi:hypothetical protein